jgi:hypothetical protein
VVDDGPDPTQAEVDAVARDLLATVPAKPRIIDIGGRASQVYVKTESAFGVQPNLLPDPNAPLADTLRQAYLDLTQRRPACACSSYPNAMVYSPTCPVIWHRIAAARRRQLGP